MGGHELTYQLLVVDDEPYICSIVSEALSSSDEYRIVHFSDPALAVDYISGHRVDLVLTDLVMGDYSGVQMLDHALACHPDCIVILMTAYPTVNNAISVLKKGAYDYLVKPFKLETLKNTVKRGLEHQGLSRENLLLKEQIELYRLSETVGSSLTLEAKLDAAAKAAKSIAGVDAVSIIVREPGAKTLVPYLVKGKAADKEMAAFLKGKHRICREALRDRDARLAGRELKDQGSVTRTLVAHPLMSRGRAVGLLNVVQEDRCMPLRPGQLHLLSIIASKVASVIENNRLYEHLQASYLKAIKALANAIEARDQYTRGHTERVTILADLIAERLNWTESQRAELKMGCTLHDIGKIGVPDAILNKPFPLTDAERKTMEIHPQLGARILEGIDFLGAASPYILYHHERFDGTGYPGRLSGEDIPVEGRLLAVVDTFDAIVSDRPYRRSATPAAAVEELQRYAGTQFDPAIVQVLVSVWQDGSIEKLGIYACDRVPVAF